MERYIKKLEEIMDVSTTAPQIAGNEDLDAFFEKYRLDESTFTHLRYFLQTYGSCYVKDGYYFTPLNSLPLIGNQQKYEIEIFLGLGNDKYSIEKYLTDYYDIVGHDFLPVAEIVGGDLIYIHKNTGEIWFWFHELAQNNLLKAANSFAEFIFHFQYFRSSQKSSVVKMNLNPKLDAFLKAAAEKEKKNL